MIDITKTDLELLTAARTIITNNYDSINYNHTVGAAIRCKNGNVYAGVNVYSSLGACAEMIAIGAAISASERNFECIVAVRGETGEEILPPCGNCRQLLLKYAPECDVIVNTSDKLQKIKAHELLPLAYNC